MNGNKEGYLKQDPIFKDRTIIYDKNGDRKGYLRRDSLMKERMNIYKK